jgi:hypothetical protein
MDLLADGLKVMAVRRRRPIQYQKDTTEQKLAISLASLMCNSCMACAKRGLPLFFSSTFWIQTNNQLCFCLQQLRQDTIDLL